MNQSSAPTFEEQIDGRKSLAALLVIAVLIVVGGAVSEHAEWWATLLVGAVILAFFIPLFRESYTSIRVDDQGLTVTDATGVRNISFSEIRSAALHRVSVSRYGNQAYIKEAVDFKTNALGSHPPVNVLYRNTWLILGFKWSGTQTVVLDMGMDKPQAIPSKHPEKLFAAIKAGLARS